jgi:hypothetical protein
MPGAICWKISGKRAWSRVPPKVRLSGLSYVVEGLRNLMKDDPIGKQLMDAQKDLADEEERLKRLQNYKPVLPFTDMSPMIERQESRVEKLREEVNKLLSAGTPGSAGIRSRTAKAAGRPRTGRTRPPCRSPE